MGHFVTVTGTYFTSEKNIKKKQNSICKKGMNTYFRGGKGQIGGKRGKKPKKSKKQRRNSGQWFCHLTKEEFSQGLSR